MDNVGYAALQIIPSFKGLDSHLERGTSGALIAAGASGGRKYGDSAGRSMASAFASHAKRAALLAGAGLVAAGAIAFKLGKDSIAEAEDAARVGAVTRNVIKSTGNAAQVSAGQVAELAEQLSLKTGVDDEVIQRGANMLLTFTNVRNEVGKGNDVFNQATGIVEDMAAAMAGGAGGAGLDLKSSAILVGKALNDPEKGLTALTRVGVAFTDQQKKQIESLVDQGKTMEAQKLILGELTKEFGGTAKAQATLGDKVGVAWGNIQEKLGTALLPLLHDVERAFLKKGVPAIEGWVDTFTQKGIPAIKNFYDEAKPVVKDILPKLGDALGTVKDVLADAAPLAKDLIDAFNDMPDWAKKAIVGGGLAAAAGSKLGLGSLLTGGKGSSGGLLGTITKAAPMPVFVTNPGFGGGLSGGTKGTAGRFPLVTGLGPPAIIGAGMTAAAHFTPVEDRNSMAPGAGGLAGDGGMTTPPGTRTQDLDDIKELFGGASDAAQDYMRTLSEAGRTTAQTIGATTGKIAHGLKLLPKEVRTDIKLNGAPESEKQARALVRQYDLTPKEKRTLFKTFNIADNQRTVDQYQRILAQTPPRKSTEISLPGAQNTISLAHSVRDAINSIPLFRNTVLTTSHGGSSGRSSAGQREAERRRGG